jgi:hypothetical protein
VTHLASPRFWSCYDRLPAQTRPHADKQFELLKRDATHRSVLLKKVGRFWSARVDSGIRALAVEHDGELIWFWMRSYGEYERLIKRG